MVSAEINFASGVFGAGVEREIVTPLGDEFTLDVLRRLQRKLVPVLVPIGTGHARG